MDTTVTTFSDKALVLDLLDSERYSDALGLARGDMRLFVEGIMLSRAEPERAKDLISTVSRSFKGDMQLRAKIALAICYRHSGENREGMVIINSVLARARREMRDRALLAKASLQIERPKLALKTLQGLSFNSNAMNGKFHNQKARVYEQLEEYDSAIIEYAGAAHYFEKCNPQLLAIAKNNEAAILREVGRFEDSHEASNRAIEIFEKYQDPCLPQGLDQKAQTHVAQGDGHEALRLIDKALSHLAADRMEVICECVITRAKALGLEGDMTASLFSLEEAQGAGEKLGRLDLLLQVAKARKFVAEAMRRRAEIASINVALELGNGSLRSAADHLGIQHSALIKAIKKHRITRTPQRPKRLIFNPVN